MIVMIKMMKIQVSLTRIGEQVSSGQWMELNYKKRM